MLDGRKLVIIFLLVHGRFMAQYATGPRLAG